jgi:hypothetical protein
MSEIIGRFPTPDQPEYISAPEAAARQRELKDNLRKRSFHNANARRRQNIRNVGVIGLAVVTALVVGPKAVKFVENAIGINNNAVLEAAKTDMEQGLATTYPDEKVTLTAGTVLRSSPEDNLGQAGGGSSNADNIIYTIPKGVEINVQGLVTVINPNIINLNDKSNGTDTFEALTFTNPNSDETQLAFVALHKHGLSTEQSLNYANVPIHFAGANMSIDIYGKMQSIGTSK